MNRQTSEAYDQWKGQCKLLDECIKNDHSLENINKLSQTCDDYKYIYNTYIAGNIAGNEQPVLVKVYDKIEVYDKTDTCAGENAYLPDYFKELPNCGKSTKFYKIDSLEAGKQLAIGYLDSDLSLNDRIGACVCFKDGSKGFKLCFRKFIDNEINEDGLMRLTSNKKATKNILTTLIIKKNLT